MADADIRYYLTGMSLDFDKGRIAATDGHRLHVADSLIVQGDANKGKSCIVPRGTVLLALAVLGKGESVTLGCGGKHVAFTVGSTRVVSKIIDGKFPDIDKVIPTHCARAATLMIANKAGAEAMKRYIALSKAAKDNRFRAAVQNGGLNGAHNVPTDAIRFGGKPTGFKLPYLIDAMTFNGGLTTEFAWFNLDASIMSRSSNRVAVVMPTRI
jgi:DNA polymerase-3 subunit beta